jgi:APA family basic amino acid/polyamine antiporter
VNLSYYKVVGFNEMKEQQEIAGAVVVKFLGNSAQRVFGLMMFLAVLAYVNVTLMNAPRVMVAMSEDGSFPQNFRQVNKSGAFPVALTVFAAASLIILYFAETFDRILNFAMFLDCIGFAASAAGIFKLRRETKELDKTGIFKIKFFPLIPLIFILFAVYLTVVIGISNPVTALTGLTVLGAFTILYFIVKRKYN